MKKILIAEDYEDLRDMYEHYLGNDYQLSIAVNGKEALNFFMTSDFDFVLTDLNMPEMNGLELIKQVKIVRPEIKAILMSNENPGEFKMGQAGVDLFLSKPFPPDLLMSSLKELSLSC